MRLSGKSARVPAAVLAAAAVFASWPALADELIVAIRGGQLGDFYIQKLGPMFEKQFGTKVTFTVDTSGPALAKVRAEGASPKTCVLWTIPTIQTEGERLGLYEKLDYAKIPNLKDIDQSLVDPENFAVPKSVDYIGITYNEKIFADKGFTPPTSWSDLFKPEYKGKVALESPADSYGQVTVAGLAAVMEKGADQRGAAAVMDRVVKAGPDILWGSSPAAMTQLLTQTDAWIAAFSSSYVWQAIDAGAPLKFIHPKEGSFPVASHWAIIKNCPNQAAAYNWVNWHISPEIQALEAETVSRFPVNQKSAALLQKGSAKVKDRLGQTVHAVPMDWKFIQKEYKGWERRLQIGQ